VLNRQKATGLSLAARVSDPASGRTMEVWTTEPGVQFIPGISWTGASRVKAEVCIRSGLRCAWKRSTFPIRTNHPSFPTTLLKPGEKYHTTTVYKFEAK